MENVIKTKNKMRVISSGNKNRKWDYTARGWRFFDSGSREKF